VFVVLLIFGVILEVLAVSVTNSEAISTALRRSCALLLEVCCRADRVATKARALDRSGRVVVKVYAALRLKEVVPKC